MNLNNTVDSSDISEVPIPRPIRLIVLLIFDIPSIICTIFVLYNIFKSRLLRRSLHNHVIIALLFTVVPTQLIDIPFHIIYLSLGYVWPSNPDFCLFWLFISIGIFDTTIILMGYASIERHMLVFHEQWLRTAKRRIILHYIPLSIVILYSLIFYIYAILFASCTNNFDYRVAWCGYPCYYDLQIISIYDTIINTILPALIVLVFSIALLLRVVIQKRHLLLRNQWRKYRKMVIQLLSISSLLIVFNFPLAVLILAHLCGLSSDVGVVFGQYAYFFTYFIPLLLPFVCLTSLPEIYHKLIRIFLLQYRKMHRQRTATVLPLT